MSARSHTAANPTARIIGLASRGLLATLLAALLIAAALAASPLQAAADVAPRASLLAIERQAMCVTCKVALDESEAPQANTEREYIQSLINRGEDETEIKRALVAQYGPTVLGLPSAHGFDLAVYLVPVARRARPGHDGAAADPELATTRTRASRRNRLDGGARR